jgi:hypothetical protein
MKKTLLTVLIATAALSAHADTLTNGLVAYYPLDGNGNDASGNGRNLTIANCSFTNGTRSSGLYYSPPTTTTDANINSYAYYSGTRQVSTNFTYSIWINPQVLTRDRDMFLLGQGSNWVSSTFFALTTPLSSTNYRYKSMFMGYGTPSPNGYDYGSYSYSTPSISSLNTNVWQHIVATAQGKTYKFYVNGIQVASITNAASLNFDMNNFFIGNQWGFGVPFQGSIDEVRIYNRALSSNEVVSLYNLDRTPPTLVYGVSGTLNYTTSSTNSSNKYNGYFVFNQSTLKSAFIWMKSASNYTLESMNDVDFHSTAPYVGGKSIYSVANTDGTFPNISKDVLWLTGANALISLTNNVSITTPSTLSGFANSLSLTNGTLISSYAASLSIDKTNTVSALTNNESFDATITRLTNNLVKQGYTPVQ